VSVSSHREARSKILDPDTLLALEKAFFLCSIPFQWDNQGDEVMNKKKWIAVVSGLLVVAAFSFYAYQKWSSRKTASREELLALMPTDASAILFIDVREMRAAPFFAALSAWAPQPQADPDYAKFVRETGFDYERDLNRVAIAFERQGQASTFFAIADGRFDRSKIASYAAKAGSVSKSGPREVFSVPLAGSSQEIFFLFLRNDRLVLTDAPHLTAKLDAKRSGPDSAEWNARFLRLSGSPAFAVLRQDSAGIQALTSQAPGGFRSPQLSSLLDQLQWATIAAKPDNDRLRVILEGECATEATARQLSDLLNGVAILAQAGLNDPNTRRQLDPEAREAYLELLKSADIARLDRAETKSVRLVLDLTPKFLDAARQASRPSAPLPSQGPAGPRKAPGT
jgi:hypothetical protein